MRKLNLMRVIGISLFATLFVSGANLYAQKDNITMLNSSHKENAQKWTTMLNKKVNLTQDQQTKIEGILVKYQTARAKTNKKNYDELQAAYNRRIESVLNNNQKKMYKEYSAQWWKDISKPVSKSSNWNKY